MSSSRYFFPIRLANQIRIEVEGGTRERNRLIAVVQIRLTSKYAHMSACSFSSIIIIMYNLHAAIVIGFGEHKPLSTI